MPAVNYILHLRNGSWLGVLYRIELWMPTRAIDRESMEKGVRVELLKAIAEFTKVRHKTRLFFIFIIFLFFPKIFSSA